MCTQDDPDAPEKKVVVGYLPIGLAEAGSRIMASRETHPQGFIDDVRISRVAKYEKKAADVQLRVEMRVVALVAIISLILGIALHIVIVKYLLKG